MGAVVEYACLEDGNVTRKELEKMIKAAAYTVLLSEGENVDGSSPIIPRIVKQMMNDESFIDDMEGVLNNSLSGHRHRAPAKKSCVCSLKSAYKRML